MSQLYVWFNKLKFILEDDLASGVTSSTSFNVRFIDSDTGEARTVASTTVIPVTIDPQNKKRQGSEFCLMTVGATTGTTTAITSMVRGLDKDGGYAITGNADNAFQWESGTEGGVTPNMLNNNRIKQILDGTLSNGTRIFLTGDGTHDAVQGFNIDGGGANNVIFGMDTSGNPIIQLEDGSSYIPGAGVGSISGGDGIDITSSVISVDLGTDPGLEFTGAGTDELSVKIKTSGGMVLDSDGLSVDLGDLSLANLGTKSILNLSDTPATFVGQEAKVLQVNAGADALAFVPVMTVMASGVDSWAVTGNSQTKTITHSLGITAKHIKIYSHVNTLTALTAEGADFSDGYFDGTNQKCIYSRCAGAIWELCTDTTHVIKTSIAGTLKWSATIANTDTNSLTLTSDAYAGAATAYFTWTVWA